MNTPTIIPPKFRPMKAEDHTPERVEQLLKETYLQASLKIDGIRGVVLNGQVYSNTLKLIPNRYIQHLFGREVLEGCDGELVVGSPYGPGVFTRSMSGVMSEGGEPDVSFYIFDTVRGDAIHADYRSRYENLQARFRLTISIEQTKLVHQFAIYTMEELLDLEQQAVHTGYEGLIIRDPCSPYKFGRSTLKQGWMLKVKRFLDREAVVIGFVEKELNQNIPTRDALGLQRRSSEKAGMVKAGTLGALEIRDLENASWQMNCGSGLNDQLRQEIWDNQKDYYGKIITYKYFPVGTKDAPRHPIFKGFRDPKDISK